MQLVVKDKINFSKSLPSILISLWHFFYFINLKSFFVYYFFYLLNLYKNLLNEASKTNNDQKKIKGFIRIEEKSFYRLSVFNYFFKMKLICFMFLTKIKFICFYGHLPKTSQFWIQILIIICCSFKCDSIKNQYNKAVGTMTGDLVLGALFPVHHAPGPAQAQTRTCGEIREQYGIQRVEAAFQTIDLINKNKKILPGIVLGIEVRDSCWYSPIALEQSIEFIRDAMAASEEKQRREKELERLSAINLNENDFTEDYKNSSNCPKQASVKNFVGVIGPASSTVTIQVQNLLQLFNIPQIGYSATSRDLSTKNYYKYFLRVVPSDLLQAQVMIDLIKQNNWTYISAVYTDGNYGSSLMEVFKGLAQDEGICIANTESVFHNADDDKFDETVRSLQQYKTTAKVVACFCEGKTVRGILKAFKRLNATGEFMLVGSDGWSDRYDIVDSLEEESVGGLSVRIHSPYVHEFDEYYFNLNPFKNKRNPWFKEFWEWKFNCSLSETISNRTSKQCTGEEKLKEKYKQDSKMAFVIKSIWTMAYGLQSMFQSLCPNQTKLCDKMKPVNGSIFLQHLLNVSFEWKNEKVLFDQSGDPPGRYDIMNFQKKSNGSYAYEMIGTWDSTSSKLNITKQIHWPKYMESPPESVCSKPCKPGHAKNFQSDSVKCCWVCVPCRENQYLKNEFTCENCPIGWRPNSNLTDCLQIPVKYIQWTETPSLVAIAIAVIGLLMTLFTMAVFIKHNDTPVVKASTKELSYLIMIGMILANCTTFFLIARPTKFNCLVARILPGFSFAIIYGSLVTKTNRIARILAGSKKRILTKKPRFMSSTSQVFISCFLVCIEIAILAFTLIKEPADSMLDYPSWDKVILVCNTTSLGISAPMGFDYFLIAMCTLYAIKTRNVPENFNEAKFIGFTMYTTIVIWGAFFPIYFGSNTKVISLCLCISLSAIIALILLFFPKLYIIILKPEKNNRSFFTTTRDVRCHIGYVPTLGISRHSSHSASDFSFESPRTYSAEQHHQNFLHANILQEKGITGGFVEAAATRALLATTTNKKKKVSVNSSNTPLNSKSIFSFFTRLRYKKRDRIKANIDQKIRAVRAAEALDRQTNIRRSRFPSKQSSFKDNGAGENSHSSKGQFSSQNQIDTQKLKLINLWKHAYLNELAKIPGLLEFIDNYKDNYVLIGSNNSNKNKRAISMQLSSKAINNGNSDKNKENSINQQSSNNLSKEKLDTGVQTSFENSSEIKRENFEKIKGNSTSTNVYMVKKPSSKINQVLNVEGKKNLEFEKTIGELKQQTFQVEKKIKVQKNQSKLENISSEKLKILTDCDPEKENWSMDDNNNKKPQKNQHHFGNIDSLECVENENKNSFDCLDSVQLLPPPPPLVSSKLTCPSFQQKFSVLTQTESLDNETESYLNNHIDISNLETPNFGLSTAEELILRVNKLSAKPKNIAEDSLVKNSKKMSSFPVLRKTNSSNSNTQSTVRVQSRFQSSNINKNKSIELDSTNVISNLKNTKKPSISSIEKLELKNTSIKQLSKENQTYTTRDELNKNFSYHRRTPSWSETAFIRQNEKDSFHEQFVKMNFDQKGIVLNENKKEVNQFKSKESLVVEESASENDEDSSAAIYKKIIISLRNSSVDLTDNDYQFTRNHSQTCLNRSNLQQSFHQNISEESNHHHYCTHEPYHHLHHRHSNQANYATYYEQMQQLQNLEHEQSSLNEEYYYNNNFTRQINTIDGQEEEEINFSNISRSEPSSTRQSRKY